MTRRDDAIHTGHCELRRRHGDGLCDCGALRPTTLLVCGTRDAPHTDAARAWVRGHTAALVDGHGVERVVHGGARGVDTLAGEAARSLGLEVVTYPADWQTHGRAAGPKRNRVMMATERPAIVLAYPRGGPGTADMMRVATEAGALVVTR